MTTRLDPPTPESGWEHTRRWWQQVNAALAEIRARLVVIEQALGIDEGE